MHYVSVGVYARCVHLYIILINYHHVYFQGHDQSSTLSQHTAELTLPKHSPLHRDLLRYAKLMEWLKNTQREKYDGLSRVSSFNFEQRIPTPPQGSLIHP